MRTFIRVLLYAPSLMRMTRLWRCKSSWGLVDQGPTVNALPYTAGLEHAWNRSWSIKGLAAADIGLHDLDPEADTVSQLGLQMLKQSFDQRSALGFSPRTSPGLRLAVSPLCSHPRSGA